MTITLECGHQFQGKDDIQFPEWPGEGDEQKHAWCSQCNDMKAITTMTTPDS